MAYQTLYRKWRPKTFDDVIGQPHITNTLKNEIKTGRLSHAYIFTGTRGTGKTSTAKILSRAVNCLNPVDGNPCNECEICKGIMNSTVLDVVEMDAASNNGVENIRDIIDQVRYATASSKYKVYIIDEVHMLSSGAFNALLKTLEEPPEHIIFILATTEIHKVLPTILSRCQRFDFKNITASDIAGAIDKIMKAENIKADADAVEYIAQLGNGSMRDALSILEQCLAYKPHELTYSDVTSILGTLDDTFLYKMAQLIAQDDLKNVLVLYNSCISEGKNPDTFAEGLLSVMREILIYTCAPEACEFTSVKKSLLEKTAEFYSREKLVRCIDVLSTLIHDIKLVSSAQILVECTLVRLTCAQFDDSTDSLLDRIKAVERRVSSQAAPFVQVNSVKSAENSNYANDFDKQNISAESENAEITEQTPTTEVVQNDGNAKNTYTDSKQEPTGDKSIIISGWNEIKSRLQDSGRLIAFVNLFGIQPKIDGNNIVLEFADRDTMNNFNTNDNINALKKIIYDMYGIDLGIKCVIKIDSESDNFVDNNDIFENVSKMSNSYPENFKLE